jgi:abhydrolase domain-containing protein 13
MPYETITIETPDNEKLHGFLIKQPTRTNERETLVFFHGNAGNIGHR